MSLVVRSVEYYHARVPAAPGSGHDPLLRFAQEGVNLLAFSAVPGCEGDLQLMLFPDKPEALLAAAEKNGITLYGPQRAFHVRGQDRIGVIAGLHRRLDDAGVAVYAATAITDGGDGFGYLMYVRPEHFDVAARALDVEVPVPPAKPIAMPAWPARPGPSATV